MSGELLLTFLVALLVFGPNKLPMLAKDLGRLWSKYLSLKQQFLHSWEAEQQLPDNIDKASIADEFYAHDRDKTAKISSSTSNSLEEKS